jgi:3'-phosphoadenosine 5'-phosphosulfate sulfotransferase (PAPS reductase)/FAD synthetase
VTPLAESVRLLGDVRSTTSAPVAVGLSGGKDSLATLDLCVRELGADRVKAFHMYLVKGLDCVERTVRWCERRYKIEVLFVPHWMLGLAYKNATYMPHRSRADGWRDTKLGDIEMAVRAKLGVEWIAYGHRMNDSIERVGMLSRNEGLDQVGRRVYPLRSWNEAAVMAYLRAKRIPQPPRLTVLKRSMTGVSFQEDVLVAIRDQYPEDFDKIVEKFPYLPAKLARYEMKKKSWKQDTYVDKWRTSLRER